jgi:fructokinase
MYGISTENPVPAVAGIGEILWDVFPENKRFGGAPANFSYIAAKLGALSYPISAVGNDDDGIMLRRTLTDLGITDRYVRTDGGHITGRVDITLSEAGVPRYKIMKNAAWDHISADHDLFLLAGRLDAICFGTLAQRNSESRSTIAEFVKRIPKEAIRLLDINLRQDYFNEEIIENSLYLSDWLKLNDEELRVVCELFGYTGSTDNRLSSIYRRYNLKVIALTLGPEGSRVIGKDTDHSLSADKIKIMDTVGAGDAFSATLVVAALAGFPLDSCHKKAAEMASFLCRHSGATPDIPEKFKLF